MPCHCARHSQRILQSKYLSGDKSCLSSSIICSPASFAKAIRADITAGILPFPGSAMPMASVRQFMELAVYIPEQEPQAGTSGFFQSQQFSVVNFSSCVGAYRLKHFRKAKAAILMFPGSMGPPLTKMLGRFRRQAAISIPGTTLSQSWG